MRITVATGALPGYPLTRTLAIAASTHADGVELMLDPRSARRDPEAVQRLADVEYIPVLSVHGVLRFRETQLETKIDDDRASVRFAAGLRDCEVVVLHPPLTGPRPSSDLNRWLDSIVRERDDRRSELRLALENRPQNHDGIERQLLDDLAVLRSVAGEWGIDVTLDLAHAASWGTHVSEALDVLRPRLANVHLSDARPTSMRGGVRNGLFRDHLMPGDGYLPIDRVLQRLATDGYAGLVTIELSPVSLHAWWPPAARQRLCEAVAAVRELGVVAPLLDSRSANRGRTARSTDR